MRNVEFCERLLCYLYEQYDSGDPETFGKFTYQAIGYLLEKEFEDPSSIEVLYMLTPFYKYVETLEELMEARYGK